MINLQKIEPNLIVSKGAFGGNISQKYPAHYLSNPDMTFM